MEEKEKLEKQIVDNFVFATIRRNDFMQVRIKHLKKELEEAVIYLRGSQWYKRKCAKEDAICTN